MSLVSLPLNSITGDQILALVGNGTRESRELEFKVAYSLKEDGQKREFVRDVAAMANTVGGDLIFGIEEHDGIAVAAPGITEFNEDDERLRIESLIGGALSPRLSGLAFKSIRLADGKLVFVVRVPRSLNAPHMVTYNGDNRFYGRHSSGRFIMDVHQVRDSFADSDALANKLREFRAERIRWIEQMEVGVRLPSPHLTVVHIFPLAAFRHGPLFDGRTLRKIDSSKLQPLRTNGGWSEVLNLDGFRVHSNLGDGKIVGYVQLFRNGCLEAVDAEMLAHYRNGIMPAYERTVRDGVHRLVTTLRELGVGGPLAVGLSLLQVRGYSFVTQRDSLHQQSIEIENLTLPEAVLEPSATEEETDAVLRVPFDLVWNACGRTGSPNYGPDGKWVTQVDPFRSRS